MSSFDNDLTRAKKLLDALGVEHPRYLDAHTLYNRLEENISRSRNFGDTNDHSASRAQIRSELDRIALEVFKTTTEKLVDNSFATKSPASHPNSSKPRNSKQNKSQPKKKDDIDFNNTTIKTPKSFNLLEVLVALATIVACIATVLALPPVQNILKITYPTSAPFTSTPYSTQTPISTETSSPFNTVAGSLLEPEQTWYSNGLEILLGKPVLYPCDGIVLAFELSFVNSTQKSKVVEFNGLDIVITDQDETFYAFVKFDYRGIASNCNDYYNLDSLTIYELDSDDRRNYALFVKQNHELQRGDFLLITIREFGDIENARWKIVVK